MPRNPILDEVHAAREALLAEHQHDLKKYLADAARRARESGRPVAKVSKRQLRRTSPAGSLPE